MKKITLFIVCLFAWCTNAQIVNIPDANFKTALLNHQPMIDTNVDGEIQLTEAQAVTLIDVNQKNISSLEGINSFSNVTELRCVSNNLTSLDVSALTNLQNLQCVGNQLASLNITGLANLDYLTCSQNQLTSLDFTGCPNIKFIVCANNLMTTLDFSGVTALEKLYCSSVPLTSINLNGLTNLKELRLSYNWMTSLNLPALPNLEIIDIGYNHLSGTLDMTSYPALKELHCGVNEISALMLGGLNNLIWVDFGGCNISTIDLSNLASLKRVSCGTTGLTSINLANTPALEQLECPFNSLTTIEINDSPNFKSLNCINNGLTSLNIGQAENVILIDCRNNQLTSLNTVAMPSLLALYCNNNLLETIDVSSSNGLHTLGYNQNPVLTHINLKNGHAIPTFYTDSQPILCPSLSSICVDQYNVNAMLSYVQFQGLSNVMVSTYCSFSPGGDHNTISGVVTFDANSNGCDSGDAQFTQVRIDVTSAFDSGSIYTDTTGHYFFYATQGTYTITPHFENEYFNFSSVAPVTFPSDDNLTETRDFCVTPIGIQNDLEIMALTVTPARPGFDAKYWIIYKNKGNQPLSGTIDFQFQDSLMDYVSSIPAIDSQSDNHLIWNYSDLMPYETRFIDLTLNVNSPLETPAVNIGDELNFGMTINPIADDQTPLDNAFGFKQIVVGSFDPNDKTCVEGSSITPAMVGDYLHYVIRFQNSGTFYAENVVVKDIIDATKFDISTLQLTASSHPQVTRITGNKVEFIFEGINLPAEQDDEPGSHGFVAFKIKTKPNLALNDVVENTADIFFDFNAPIVTNTTSTTVSTLGLGHFDDTSVTIAPNPVQHILVISAEDEITSIQLFDIQGRLLQTKLENNTIGSIDFTGKTSGVYFVKVQTEKGMKVQKVVKE